MKHTTKGEAASARPALLTPHAHSAIDKWERLLTIYRNEYRNSGQRIPRDLFDFVRAVSFTPLRRNEASHGLAE